MPRPRKIASEQSGHLTSAQQAKRERETELAIGDASALQRAPKKLLLDKVAVAKWRYIVRVKQADRTLSNSDFDNLVVYCNAWSQYMKAVELQRQLGADPELIAAAMRMEKQATDILYRYGARLGLDLNSRLKTAALKVEKEQDAVEQEFGDI
ncbi:MAG: P27 family phage terminase small subunit [Clostridium sp.]|nr:P27 family phage terminase small subunit [Clostridium sp.]